jgi:hypothetical protein
MKPSTLEIMEAPAARAMAVFVPPLKRAARRAAHYYAPLPSSRSPFKRVLHALETIQAIVLKGLKPIDQQIELDALPPYQSRGHGGKHRPTSRLIGGQWAQDRSKYTPGECFREGKR